MGAEVTMWAAMHSNLLQATSQSSPVFSPNGSLLMSLGGEDHFARLQRYWQLGTLEQTPERWSVLSPTYAVDRIQAPSLMQMSEQEYRYGLDYLVPMIRKHTADVYVFPNEPHQKFNPGTNWLSSATWIGFASGYRVTRIHTRANAISTRIGARCGRRGIWPARAGASRLRGLREQELSWPPAGSQIEPLGLQLIAPARDSGPTRGSFLAKANPGLNSSR